MEGGYGRGEFNLRERERVRKDRVLSVCVRRNRKRERDGDREVQDVSRRKKGRNRWRREEKKGKINLPLSVGST